MILKLEISDWNDEIEDSRIFDVHENCATGKLTETPFNFSVTTIDMAVIVCITTTQEDLVKYGLEFLDIPELTPKYCPPNCWRKYNPETWRDPENNGRYFEIDSYIRNQLWLCVDKIGREYMTNYYPHRMEDWDRNREKIIEYYDGKLWKPDFFTTFEGSDMIPVFTKYLLLPHGFIENYLGHPLTYQDEPVEYVTFKFEDLDIWKE